MTNKEIQDQGWVYIPHPEENFSNKKKGKYVRLVGENTIEEYDDGHVKSYTYPDKEKRDLIWDELVKGTTDDSGNES